MRKLTLQDCVKVAADRNGKCLSVEYTNNRGKMSWMCSVGHTWQSTFDHVKAGSWCARCSASALNSERRFSTEYINDFVSKKGWKCHTKEYLNNSQLLSLECNFGHFWEAPFKRIKNQETDCPYCAEKHQYTIEEIHLMVSLAGDNIVCINTKAERSRDKLQWECRKVKHSWVSSLYKMKTTGFSCYLCNKDDRIKYTWNDVKQACIGTSLDFLNCPNLNEKVFNTKNIGQMWQFKCACEKIIFPSIMNVIDGRNKSCGCMKSHPQREVFNFIKELNFEANENDNSIIRSEKKGLELDIYIPEKKIAIEYCGLYWHGEKQCGIEARTKHIKKLRLCQEKDIRLITIFEDEWLLKQEQAKGYLKAILGKAEVKIDARKCEIKMVEYETAKEFHTTNHIQGHANGKHIGLYFNDELVCLSTFAKPSASRNAYKDNDSKMELMRYTAKINYSVRGGLGKLLAYFGRNSLDIKEIVSYSDNRWSNGNVYKALGFELINTGKPSYFYFKNGDIDRRHRFNFTKHNVLKLFGGDKNDTEWQIMLSNGYDRIWDCGSSKWALKNSNYFC